MTATQKGSPAGSELPIYQGLLNELEPAARATVIAQQGEGHDTEPQAPDEGHQHLAQLS